MQFHSRLKKPVMTKRSSVSSSSPQTQSLDKSPTPTFDLNKSPSPRSLPSSPVSARRRTLTGSDPTVSTDSDVAHKISATLVPEKNMEKEHHKLGLNTGVKDLHSSPSSSSSLPTTSTLGSTWSGLTLASEPELPPPHPTSEKPTPCASVPALPSPASTQTSPYALPPTLSQTPSPKETLSRANANTSPKTVTSTITPSVTYRPPSLTLPLTSISTTIPTVASTPASADVSTATTDTTFDTTRMSLSFSDSDGAVGIGLSLLQDLANGSGFSDDDTDSEDDASSRQIGPSARGSASADASNNSSWMRSRTPSPNINRSEYSVEEGDSMRTEVPNEIGEMGDDERLQYEDDDTEQGHEDEHEDQYDVDQIYSDDEYEEDEDTTEGFDINDVALNLIPSTSSTFVSTPPKPLHHRLSPLHSTSRSPPSTSPPSSTSPQHLTFPPVAPLSPQRYRSFRQQQQMQFNFPAPPTHTPIPISVPTPVLHPTSTPMRSSASPHASLRTSASTSTSSSSPSPRSLHFSAHLSQGLASHPGSPLSANFPFPGSPSPDGDGRDRERRPSFASHLSNTTGTASSDWDGAGDIYDDYRYSRSSMAGTVRTTSAASANTHGRNGSGSGMGSRRVSAGSRRTSAGSTSVRRVSAGMGLAKMNGGEMPPPFVDNPEARMRADSGPQQLRTMSASMLMSTVSAGVTMARSGSVRVPAAVDHNPGARGAPTSHEDLDEDLGGGQKAFPNGSGGQTFISSYPKVEEVSVADDDDDVSVYTQSSIGRGSMASVARSSHHQDIPSIPTAASTLSSTAALTPTPSARATISPPRPAPLSLAVSNGLTASGPSPLLHTTWGSPISSNPAATPAYVDGRSASGYAPLIAGGLGALSRALVAGVTAIVGNKSSSSSDTEATDVGAANVQRQQNESVPKPPPSPMVSHTDTNTKVELRLREDGVGTGSGRGVVVEDQEEDDSVVLSASPVSLRNAGTSGGMLRTVRQDSPEPELEMMKGRLAPLVVANRTPSPASIRIGDTSMEKEQKQKQEEPEPEPEHEEPDQDQDQDQEGLEQEELEEAAWEKGQSEESASVASSTMHTEASQVLIVPPKNSTEIFPNSTLQLPSSSSPLSPSHSVSPTPSSSPQPTASHLRPSLLELRGGQLGAGQSQRRSLFLPHPNAPKAPAAHSPGPMYIAQQLPRPPQLQARNGAVQTIKMALSGHGASGSWPTIYGRTHLDLVSSIGPVLMTFSVDPPSATAPPPSTSASPSRALSPSQSSSPLPTKGQANHAAPSSVNVGAGGGGPEQSAADQRGSGVIPRANFFPKAGGARPRSRSFSGFNSQDTEIPFPIQRRSAFSYWDSYAYVLIHLWIYSHEEGSASLNLPSVGEVRRSLSSSPSSSKTFPLRVSSPLAMSQGNTAGLTGASSPRPSGSPLAPARAVSVSTTPSLNNRPVFQSKQMVSRTESSPAKPLTVARTTISDPNSSSDSGPTSPVFPAGSARDPAPDATLARTRDTDAVSIHSTRSNVISPPPSARNPSLRTKLSLPGLRRNLSRQDDTSSTGSQPTDSETMQVKDMDFELVRPNLLHLQSHTSEDLGRDGLSDFKYPNPLHTDSPAVSTPSPRSPIVSDSSPRQPIALPSIQSKSSDSEPSMDAHRQREQKWMSVLSTVPPPQSKKSKKVRKLLLEGVPSSVRYLVWTHLTDGKARCVPGVYAQLGARGRVPAFVDIERDVQRCFNDHPHFQTMQGSTVSLLQAYLTMVPDIQYTTGEFLFLDQVRITHWSLQA